MYVNDRNGAKFTVGVVGCGYWGSKHLRVLQSVEGVDEVVAIDKRINDIPALAHFVATGNAYADLDAALPRLDAVVVATPPSRHVDVALEALTAGKHVLVEKPLATSTAGASELIAAANAHSVVLMVGHTFEYNPAVWKLRELVQSGELGDIYYLDSARLNLGLYQSDVNVVFDLAPHDISIANHVLGSIPTSVEAWGSRHVHKRYEDVAYLSLDYADIGVRAHIHVSWLDPQKVRLTTAVGSKKMAVYNDLIADERIRVHEKSVVQGQNGAGTTISYRNGDTMIPALPSDEPLNVQDSHFVACGRAGERPRTDGANGLAVVQVLEAAQRAMTEHRRVDLDELAWERDLAGVSVPAGSAIGRATADEPADPIMTA